MQRIVGANAGRTLEFKIDRGGAPVTLQRHARAQAGQGRLRQQVLPGDAGRQPLDDAGRRQDRDGRSVHRGRRWARRKPGSSSTARSPTYRRIFAGRECADQLGGPIRIAQISGQVASVSFAALMHLTAMLSVSIGLLNLFPVPLLDGGHLMFYAIEAVRGRPAVRTRPGDRLPDRARPGADVDDFCNLQRHHPSRHVVRSHGALEFSAGNARFERPSCVAVPRKACTNRRLRDTPR